MGSFPFVIPSILYNMHMTGINRKYKGYIIQFIKINYYFSIKQALIPPMKNWKLVVNC